MSGIAGIFHRDGSPVSAAAVQGMMAAAPGSPGAHDVWAQESVGLGHCQLPATPESRNERQPLVSTDGNYAITCDGRVDNRAELIQALQGRAPASAETSDAELVLHSYIAWGAGCLKHIVGDFAFVIWDGPQQQLFCARDPMGIRTFYYYLDQSRFVFASDIRSVQAGASVPQELNQLMTALYLLGRFNEGEQTFFNGIFQILPAQYLVISRDRVIKEAYWEPDPWEPIHYARREEYIEHLQQALYEAVRCRLRAVSPVGLSLSGGMDSTSIACAAACLISQGQAPGTELRAFSSVFTDFPSVDEREYIRKVLERWEIEGHYTYADGLWGFRPLQNAAAPLNRPYPLPFQARHEARLLCARELGIRVMLTGEGGDELLNPGIWYLVDLLKGLRWGALRHELRYVTPDSRRSFRKTAFQFYKSALWDLVPSPAKQVYRKLHPRETPEWLSERFIRQSGALEHEVIRPPKPKSRSLYRQSQYNGCISLPRLPFLPYLTEMYARYGIEPRHPFLDRRVIEFLIRVPPHLKFSGGYTKLLLREAMEGLLPDEVRLRVAKTHFLDVFKQGVQQEQGRIGTLLKEGYLVKAGWVREQSVKTLLDRFLAGEPGLNSYLVALVTLEEWAGDYFGSNGSGDPARLPCLAPERAG